MTSADNDKPLYSSELTSIQFLNYGKNNALIIRI